jgi:hypothetical protein
MAAVSSSRSAGKLNPAVRRKPPVQSRGLFFDCGIVCGLPQGGRGSNLATCSVCHPLALWCVQTGLTENIMTRPAKRLFATCLAVMVAGAGSEVIAAAESAVPTQDLVNVRVAGQVTASWTRQPDYYALQVVMEASKPGPPRAGAPTKPNSEPVRGALDAADASQTLQSQNMRGAPPPYTVGGASQDRSSYFIGNTIASLRGLDPAFGCRTLTLVDGRRLVSGQAAVPPERPAAAAPPVPVVQSYPPRVKHPRIEVWVLKADGTHIVPANYTCTLLPAVPAVSGSPATAARSRAEEFTYRYSIADSAQAVAAAIRIDNDFYIEQLQPLESTPTAQ